MQDEKRAANKRARLVSVSEEELATAGQIDAMMASSSACGSSSGCNTDTETAPRTQGSNERQQAV